MFKDRRPGIGGTLFLAGALATSGLACAQGIDVSYRNAAWMLVIPDPDVRTVGEKEVVCFSDKKPEIKVLPDSKNHEVRAPIVRISNFACDNAAALVRSYKDGERISSFTGSVGSSPEPYVAQVK